MDLVEIRKKSLKESASDQEPLLKDRQDIVSSVLNETDANHTTDTNDVASHLDDEVSNIEVSDDETHNGLIIDDYPISQDETGIEIDDESSLAETSDMESVDSNLDLLSQEESLLDIDDSTLIDLHPESKENHVAFEIIPESEVITDDSIENSGDVSENIDIKTIVDEVSQYSDPLEALFASSSSELELATEENYFDGLLGSEKIADDDTKQLLSFMLSEEEYAVAISSVREIIKVKDVTEIPRVPSYILGLLSLRGVIIPVFDLNQRLNLGTTEIGNQSRIVVCQQGNQYAGFLVDRINQVVKISEDKIEAAPSILSTLDRDFVQGIGRLKGRMIILLDLEIVMAISH